MQVVCRADASVALGAGHVMRCLALAHEVCASGGEMHFLCREEDGHLCDLVQREGFSVDRLPAHAQISWENDARACLDVLEKQHLHPDWLVADHYGISECWEAMMRTAVRHIFVIDDLANRRHNCDLLLDQNLRDENPYRDLVPPTAELLLGPDYALLREEFRQARKQVVGRQGTVRHMVVFFGGSDPSGETVKALTALQQLSCTDIEVDVIVGENNPRKNEVAELCAALLCVRFHCQVDDMARFLALADLALGAAGISSWERLVLGLPALVVAVADNQMENMRQLHLMGAAVGLGISSEITATTLAQAIEKILACPEVVRDMSMRALGLVDGEGARRVVERMAARVM